MPARARRDARYCSDRCRQRKRRGQQDAPVPAELVTMPRWVRASGRKLPLTADGRVATTRDRSGWTDYPTAAASTAGVGLGFVLAGDGTVCLDLDHCLTDGVPNAAASALLELAGPTWVEVSPSGTGLHVWGRATLPADGHRVSYLGQPVEAYAARRYITVTLRQHPGSVPVLGDINSAVQALRLR